MARVAMRGVFLLLLAMIGMAEAAPQRIASINLCTDQLLLDLADSADIAGLSPFARDAARSWGHEKAKNHPLLSGHAEDVLMLRPSLVLAGSFTRRATRDMLKSHGLRVEEFAPARTLDEARAQTRRMAELVGQPARGERRIAELDAAIAAARNAASTRPLRALMLQRRGWVSGSQSLAADLLATIGLANAAGAEKGGRIMRLEDIIMLKPDLLVLARDDAPAEDQGRALLGHAALEQLVPANRRLYLPENLSICGGPMLKEALESLTRQLQALE